MSTTTTSPMLTVRQQIHAAHDTAKLLSAQIMDAYKRAGELQADLLMIALIDEIPKAEDLSYRLQRLCDACPTTWPVAEPER